MNKRGVIFSLGTFLILFVTLTFALALLRFDQVIDDEISDASVRETILYHSKDIGYDIIGLTGATLYTHGTPGGSINLTGRIQMGPTNFSNAIYNYTIYYQSYVTPNMDIGWASPLYNLEIEGYNGSLELNATSLYAQLADVDQMERLILRMETNESYNFGFWSDAGSSYPQVDVYITNATGTATYSANLDPAVNNFLAFDNVFSIEFGDVGGIDGALYIQTGFDNITELYIEMKPIKEAAYLRTTQHVNLTLAGQNIYAPISIAELGR